MTTLNVLLSGNGSTLQALIDAVAAGQCPATITRVISNNKDAYGLERATKAGISTEVIQTTDKADYHNALQQALEAAPSDYILLAGYMRIVDAATVNHFAGKMLNIHPSLLPHYPGLNTYRRALEAGDTEHGTSIHFVTDDLDAGPIIAQARLAIQPGETEDSLKARTQALEHRLYPLVVSWLCENRVRLVGKTVYFDDRPLSSTGLQLTKTAKDDLLLID
jgi:phosphoribosylglycinamide formyltransferase 1